jgi:hypothetical protein
MDKVDKINVVILRFFASQPDLTQIPSKDLMPQFIEAGIFLRDHKNGLPIRNLLRDLDSTGQLSRIPSVFADRKLRNTNWFFTNYQQSNSLVNNNEIKVEQQLKPIFKTIRNRSDEHYVLDLCDQVLARQCERQCRFDFLLGDLSPSGKRVKLPVDAYYSDLKLVVEYRETQHFNENKHFDKPDILTISGVHRGAQRRIYDKRREEIFPLNGIELLLIPYSAFTCNSQGKIIRNSEKDINVITRLLRNYMQTQQVK